MSDQNKPFDGDFSRQRILSETVGHMIAGAGIGGAAIVGFGVFVYVLYLIGTLLPAESKEAVDPTPDSFSVYIEYVDTDHV